MPATSVRSTSCDSPRAAGVATIAKSSGRPWSARSRSMPSMAAYDTALVCMSSTLQDLNSIGDFQIRGRPATAVTRGAGMSVTIGALRESTPRETRVCLVPEVADKLTREGARVLMERGAGERASFPDSLYKSVTWADSAAGVLAASEVILTVQPLSVEQIQQLKSSAVVIGFMQPHARAAEVRALKARGVTSFAMELVPRISRAQSM